MLSSHFLLIIGGNLPCFPGGNCSGSAQAAAFLSGAPREAAGAPADETAALRFRSRYKEVSRKLENGPDSGTQDVTRLPVLELLLISETKDVPHPPLAPRP
ncbi:hypothetical protein Q8A73_006482 [Channa argus]|nr:hypothetical protein Q8A73_006482 [Channa argus]